MKHKITSVVTWVRRCRHIEHDQIEIKGQWVVARACVWKIDGTWADHRDACAWARELRNDPDVLVTHVFFHGEGDKWTLADDRHCVLHLL